MRLEDIQITRLASAGYVVLMPDLFSRGGARKCLTATFKALSSGKGQAFDDVEAAKQLLLARPDTTKKVGLSARNIDHDIKEYPDAGHAFMNPTQAGGPVFGTLLRITGAKPNPEAAKDAWQRIENFFGKHLH